eukprot:2796232-Rhodomonas_salina.1
MGLGTQAHTMTRVAAHMWAVLFTQVCTSWSGHSHTAAHGSVHATQTGFDFEFFFSGWGWG